VYNRDALDLLYDAGFPQDVTVVYADPPYTSDQYSRYYHIYETMYWYDYPVSQGIGRYPSVEDRFSTAFSHKAEVARAFDRLAAAVVGRHATLVLSYPSDGLLTRQGHDLGDIVRRHFPVIELSKFDHTHSTLGSAHGSNSVEVTEWVIVARS
jgi:adenine-specific DNA-methyltransferase